jgi:DNA-binding IclR family transcriptional regulator
MSLKSENKYNVPGLDRALTIIELLNERTEGLSVNEVAAYLKLPVNSVYRIMTTLERRRYIQKSKGEARYNLSEKLLQLTTPVTGDPSFLETVIPHLYELRDQTKESLLAGVILGNEGIVLEQIDGVHNFSFRVNPGLRFPLHTSAPGKAYLADLDEKNRNRIISGLTLTRFTKNTLTSPEKLIDECKGIKKLGYAVDNEE